MEYLILSILRPLARLLVRRGIGFAQAEAALRRAYMQAAEEAAGPGATDSRLSLLTGLQRREVVRLRALPPEATAPPANHLSRLVAQWLALHQGADLPRRGPSPSFEALALSVRRDVHPRSLLDQLEAAGTVAVEGDAVRLLTPAYQPLAGSEAQLDYLAANAGDHLAAGVANVIGPARHLDRAVHYDHLSPQAVEELAALWRERAGAALAEVNARAARLQDDQPGTRRMRAGAYFWEEDTP